LTPNQHSKIQRNYNLRALNCLAIPALAQYFWQCETKGEVLEAIAWANENNLKINVLGGGSNIICQDSVQGLTLLPNLSGINVENETSTQAFVRVACGVNWHQFVKWSLENCFFGLENLALIPGLVGAAPIQNIGAYGVEVCQFIEEVVAVNLNTGEEKIFSSAACQFAYRDSVFKGPENGKYLIVSVLFRFPVNVEPNTAYLALNTYLKQNSLSATPRNIFEAVCSIRSSKLPDPTDIPNVGSFFKNPVVSIEDYENLLKEFPDIVSYPAPGGKKLAAAWLIDRAGWKGREIDGVRIHPQQALVLTNPGRRSAEAVLTVAQKIQTSISDTFGVELEVEPQLF